MARTLPKPTVSAIETALQIAHAQEKTPDMQAIATIFSTTYETVTRIRRRLLRFEATGIDERKRSGPKYLKSQNEEAVTKTIRTFVEANPGVDQKTVGDRLEKDFGVTFSQSTISRLMKVKGIPHKKTNRYYKKARLVSTHPDGRVMPLPEEREMETLGGRMGEGEGLSIYQALVMAAPDYVSPYAAPPRVAAGSSSGVEVPMNSS